MNAISLTLDSKLQARARRSYLKAVVANGGRTRTSTSLLVLDALAAIGFAAGLSQAVAVVQAGTLAVLPWAGLALASATGRGICTTLAVRVGAEGARTAKLRLRRRIVDAAFDTPAGGNATTGTLMSAAVDEVEAIDGYVARFLPARQAAALAPFLVLTATAIASPVAAAILTTTLVPFIVAMALAGGAAADESRAQFVALARLSGLFADRIRALPVVLAFRAEEEQAHTLGIAAEALAKRTMRVLRVAFLSSAALEFFSALSVALVAVYAGFNLLGLLPFPVPETLDLGRAFFVLALAPEFYAPMRRLAAAYHDRQAAETAAERLDVLERAAAARPRRILAASGAVGVRYADVSICYPGEDHAAVSAFSLNITPGECVALVGPSGSGKSSLLHLLLGLAPLSGGTVNIGGMSLADCGGFAKLASWVGQSPLIVAGTIRDNIALANRDSTDTQIVVALEAAGLGAMLGHRENGLDSAVDPRGSGLSGGERRRIALARALLKPAPLLLLDEPTAHLDALAERALIATIRNRCRGRTTLIATHSEALAAIADRIVRL